LQQPVSVPVTKIVFEIASSASEPGHYSGKRGRHACRASAAAISRASIGRTYAGQCVTKSRPEVGYFVTDLLIVWQLYT